MADCQHHKAGSAPNELKRRTVANSQCGDPAKDSVNPDRDGEPLQQVPGHRDEKPCEKTQSGCERQIGDKGAGSASGRSDQAEWWHHRQKFFEKPPERLLRWRDGQSF